MQSEEADLSMWLETLEYSTLFATLREEPCSLSQVTQ